LNWLFFIIWIILSVASLLCWFGVVANIKNEFHDSIFSNEWLFNPEHLEKPGMKYRLAIIVITPVWLLLICGYFYWR
jgi:hypothetical protein